MTRLIKYSLLLLAFCFCHFNLLAQLSKVDSFKTLLKTVKEDTSRVKYLNDLAQELMYNNPDTSIILGKQALTIAKNLSTSQIQILANSGKNSMASTLGNLGIYYYFKGDYSTSIDHYLKALKIEEELKNKSGMARHLGNLGIVYEDQGDYSKALEYYLKALKIGEELVDKKRIAIQLSNIGVIYVHQTDYPKALEYYFKALKVENELGNKNGNAYTLGHIAGVYNAQAKIKQSYDKSASDSLYLLALDHYFKALKQAEELNNKNLVAAWLCNIGNVYRNQENYNKALDYYFKYLKMAEELGNKNYQAISFGNIGSVYTAIGKYNDAYSYLYRALAIDDSIGVMDNVKSWNEQLSYLYEKSTIPLQDTVGGKILTREEMRLRSLHYYKNYINLRDILFSEENKKQLLRKEMNFDFEKKEAATKAEQDKKDTISKAELKQKEQERNYFILGFILVAFLAALIFRGYKQKQKANEIISIQKILVEEKQKEILDSIHYAKRIQHSLLPTEKYIEKSMTRLLKK